MKKNLPLLIRLFISALFLLSAFAKLYPTPMYGITKIFEEGQLIPLGFSEEVAPYISRFIIAIEFFIAFTILQTNYLRRIVLPLSIGMIAIFSLHLSYSVFLGDSENCGCFGELIPMSPIEALIKNIFTILLLLYLYKNTNNDGKRSFSELSVYLLSGLLLMFALIPIQKGGKVKQISNFSKYVVSDMDMNDGKKILCFFDAGCDHCMDAAKSLSSLSDSIQIFPKIHIIFSDSEEDKIPEFFNYVGKEFSYQVLPFYKEDDEINSYLEILGYDYENPAVIYYDNGNQIRFYDGTGVNAYNEDEFKKLFE